MNTPTIYQLWKEFHFEAAHSLRKVPPNHPCHRLHGHSYRVRIHCEGPLDPQFDWVVDYADITAATQPVIAQLDHQNLNDLMGMETTAENLARYIAEHIRALPHLVGVEVFETPSTSVFLRISLT